MTTWNTTYNYNMPNMNFGQAMLYGAFGSLTGMGGFGCGMGGSIFSNMGMMGMGGFGCGSFGGYGMGMSGFGMGGYGCGMSNQGIGAMIGMIVAGAGLAFANQAITEHKASKADVKTTSEQITALETNAKTDLATLQKGLTLSTYKKNNAPSYYNTAKLDQAILDAANNQIITLGKSKSDLLKERSALKDSNGNSATTGDPTYDAYTAKIEAIDEKIKKLQDTANLKNLTTDTCDSTIYGSDVAAAVKAKEDRIDAVDAAVENLDEVKDKYDDLIKKEKEEENEAKQNSFENYMNEVDGNTLTRTKKSKLQQRITDNIDFSTSSDLDENDVQGAIAAFRKAKTNNEKQKWYGILNKMASNTNLVDNIDKNLNKVLSEFKKPMAQVGINFEL